MYERARANEEEGESVEDPVQKGAVADHYDCEVAWEDARGAGLIYFLSGDHLSPMLNNDDEYALEIERWREGTSLRVLDLAAQMGIARGERSLDLGTGIGGPGRDICGSCGCEVVGLNVSSEQMENLVAISRRQGSPYELVVRGDMQNEIPFVSGAFEHVFAINSMFHARRFEEAIAEVSRVLVPKGCFGVDDWFVTGADPVVRELLGKTWTAAHGLHDFDRFVAALRDAGFRVEDIVDYSVEAGDFLSEERFGRVYDEQAPMRLITGFSMLWPDLEMKWATLAVEELRRDILLMGDLYRQGDVVYRQIIARKK
jgi:SAM-dependent methyltransferase